MLLNSGNYFPGNKHISEYIIWSFHPFFSLFNSLKADKSQKYQAFHPNYSNISSQNLTFPPKSGSVAHFSAAHLFQEYFCDSKPRPGKVGISIIAIINRGFSFAN